MKFTAKQKEKLKRELVSCLVSKYATENLESSKILLKSQLWD